MDVFPFSGEYSFRWKLSPLSFLIEGFRFMAFVNFLSCNDPQFLEEVVKF